MASERDTITVLERFTAPCPQFPNGRWERKIGGCDWEDVVYPDDKLPILFLQNKVASVTQEIEMTREEAELRWSKSAAAAPKKEGQ